jgi:hypothetical protein
MVRVRARVMTFSFILCLLAVLVCGISVDPPQAMARPYSTGGPDGTFGTGDPTGDDQPSPTPKPTKMLAAGKAVHSTGTTTVQGIPTSVRWNLVLSILIRLGLR